MIHRGDRAIRTQHLKAALLEHGESLRRGHFMHEVQIDIEHGGSTRLFGDDVIIPDFLEQCLGILAHGE